MDIAPTPKSTAPQLAHKPNRNGWTDEKKTIFLKSLAGAASVTAAAAGVGMTPQSAHWLKRHPAAGSFSDDWDAAVAQAWEEVQSTAFDRLLNGEVQILCREGMELIRHRPCSPALVIHMLDRAALAGTKAERTSRKAAPIGEKPSNPENPENFNG